MSFRFIDSHAHFWDLNILPNSWLTEVRSIAHRHTPAELLSETRCDPPEKIVFVQCGAPGLDEAKWVEQLAATETRVAGIVAALNVNAGKTTLQAIEQLKEIPLVRGVRHLIQDELDANYCVKPAFIEGIQQLSAHHLSFDICCREHQLPAVIELVRRCPEVSFILDHAGKPRIRAGALDPWRGYMRTLASFPNLVCKLSGLITEADFSTWSIEVLCPFVDELLGCFGPLRLLFGSDWPVAKLAGSYPQWLAAAQTLTAQLSPADQAAIFFHNARQVYRLS